MELSEKKIINFQKKILSFYEKDGRDLPWRKTTNPYFILLSEIMLQQTQVSRGLEYYNKWVIQWPTLAELASASKKEVLSAWMGLGYNSRALRLLESAKIIISQYHGDIIFALENYKLLPGIGPYTAAAVTIFSTNKDVVTVDTNIRRILIHEFLLSSDISDKELWELAKNCLPLGKSRDWHNALMDYGALFLTSKSSSIKPKTKQSKFKGSDREIRAKVLRFLLNGSYSLSSLLNLLVDFDVDSVRLDSILIKLLKENIIGFNKNKYFLIE